MKFNQYPTLLAFFYRSLSEHVPKQGFLELPFLNPLKSKVLFYPIRLIRNQWVFGSPQFGIHHFLLPRSSQLLAKSPMHPIVKN